MSKGSGRRKHYITDAQIEEAWDSIFAGHPSDEQFERVKGKTILTKPSVDAEDDYGNILPSSMSSKDKQPLPNKPKRNDPDRFVDDIGDS